MPIISIGLVSTLAGGLGGTSTGSSNGLGTYAGFNKPTGVSVDSNGNIYVADFNNHLIRKISRLPAYINLIYFDVIKTICIIN